MTTTTGPLCPGEPVTLILPDHIVQTEVATSTTKSFSCPLTSRGGKQIVSEHALDREGQTFLRGYHAADSDAVKAARTAAGLAGAFKEAPAMPGVQAFTTAAAALPPGGMVDPALLRLHIRGHGGHAPTLRIGKNDDE